MEGTKTGPSWPPKVEPSLESLHVSEWHLVEKPPSKYMVLYDMVARILAAKIQSGAPLESTEYIVTHALRIAQMTLDILDKHADKFGLVKPSPVVPMVNEQDTK